MRRSALIAAALVVALLVSVGFLHPAVSEHVFGFTAGAIPLTVPASLPANERKERMPSLLNVVDAANGEVADGPPSVATETEDVIGQRNAGGAASPTANLFAAPCVQVLARFADAHRAVVEAYHGNRSKIVAGSAAAPTDVWTGLAPVCGIHKLFNLTGVVFAVTATATESTFGVNRANRLLIVPCVPPNSPTQPPLGAPQDKCHDVYFAVRLRSATAIVDAVVSPVSTTEGGIGGIPPCSYSVSFFPYDAGDYFVEVRVVWLDGLGPEKSHKVFHPVTLLKTHSKFGKKPHQSYVFNAECERQSHLTLTPLALTVASQPRNDLLGTVAASASPTPTRLCRRGDGEAPGRWVKNDNAKPCGSDSAICEGSPSLLNDVKPFNEDWIWVPERCHYRFWRHGSGPESPCTSRPGTLLMMGDSTTREYAQNVALFNLKASGLTLSYANWRIEHKWYTQKMARDALVRLGDELKAQRPVVLVVNLGPLHLIAGVTTTDWEFYVDQWAALFARENTTFATFMERRFFLGLAAVHYATSDMSAQRLVRWTQYARARLVPLGFEFLDAWRVTAARPEATWDGVHYAAERGKAQMRHVRRGRQVPTFKWNGGVSVMLTTMLLNLLCNR